MKAILVINDISTDLNIEELRADIKVNCYGDVIAIYNNVSLKPMPKKKIHIAKYNIWKECSKEDKEIMIENRGYNKCVDELLGEK